MILKVQNNNLLTAGSYSLCTFLLAHYISAFKHEIQLGSLAVKGVKLCCVGVLKGGYHPLGGNDS